MKDHTALLDQIPESTETVARPELPLREVLCQIGVRPFTPESVAAYKKAMVRKRFQFWNNEPSDERMRFWVGVGLVLNSVAFYGVGCALTHTLSFDFSLECLSGLPLICFAICFVWGQFVKDPDSL